MEDFQSKCQRAQVWPSKFNPRADRKRLKVATRNPKMSSRDLQQAPDVDAHASTIKERLRKLNFHGRCARRKPCLSKNYTGAKPDDQDFWNNVLWTDESKVELFGRQNRGHVRGKRNTAFQEKNLILTVKRAGGSVMVMFGDGQLTITESTVNSSVYLRVLEERVSSSVQRNQS